MMMMMRVVVMLLVLPGLLVLMPVIMAVKQVLDTPLAVMGYPGSLDACVDGNNNSFAGCNGVSIV